jgi:hypothetical protein
LFLPFSKSPTLQAFTDLLYSAVVDVLNLHIFPGPALAVIFQSASDLCIRFLQIGPVLLLENVRGFDAALFNHPNSMISLSALANFHNLVSLLLEPPTNGSPLKGATVVETNFLFYAPTCPSMANPRRQVQHCGRDLYKQISFRLLRPLKIHLKEASCHDSLRSDPAGSC